MNVAGLGNIAYQATNLKLQQVVRQTVAHEPTATKGASPYDVSISSAGQDALSKATKAADEQTISALQGKNAQDASKTTDANKQDGTKKTKGLSADTVQALKDDIDQSYNIMIQTMTAQNAKLQAYQDDGIAFLRFSNGRKVATSALALPPVATTPEEAKKALADGGDWSVGKVADRIMNLATAIAGDDPNTLQQMRAAVEEGFRQAGVAFKSFTGRDKMPQITQDTHDEINRRFDDLLKKSAASQAQGLGPVVNNKTNPSTKVQGPGPVLNNGQAVNAGALQNQNQIHGAGPVLNNGMAVNPNYMYGI